MLTRATLGPFGPHNNAHTVEVGVNLDPITNTQMADDGVHLDP